MTDVPTLHIRNVPEEVYEGLREQAKERGTSMNAEAIGILEEGVRWKRRSWDEVMTSIEENAKKIGFGPDWPAPEDVIREARDSR
jgi:plasmid stability protein